jgi:Trk-type K+ transport system membrane component
MRLNRRLTWLRRTEVWFLLAVLGLTAVGALLLDNQVCRVLDEREWRWFGKMNAWQAVFDAMSATCGVGLLTGDVNENYTPLGRWLLSVLGIAGAVLYLTAALQLLGRLFGNGESVPAAADPRVGRSSAGLLPRVQTVLISFFVLLAASIVFVVLLEWRISRGHDWTSSGGFNGSAWRAIAAFASLGWLPGSPPRGCAWIYAVVALLGGLGWAAWLSPLRLSRRPAATGRYGGCFWAIVGVAVAYLAFLAITAGAICCLEAPREAHGRADQGPSAEAAAAAAAAAAEADRWLEVGSTALTGQPITTRYVRSLVQTVCASGAGIPTERFADRHATDGTKVVLSATMLVGPLGGGAGGGIKLVLLVWVVGAVVGVLRRRRVTGETALPLADAGGAPLLSGVDQVAVRCLLAGIGTLVSVVLLALLVAIGLLVLENYSATTSQLRPTFADALLDASSAVAGGNLSSGLAQAVMSRMLFRGIQQNVDLYQYGMAWLMLAMLLGRLLPLLVLGRVARVRLPQAPSALPLA